jgi:hypothetical protein
MAKKNNNKTAAKRPAQNAKQPVKNTGKNKPSEPIAEQLIDEPFAEVIDTETEDAVVTVIADEPAIEAVEISSEEMPVSDAAENTADEEAVDIAADNSNEVPADAVSPENAEIVEPEKGNIVPFIADASAEQISADPEKKSRKPRLGNDITHKLVGCTYHYFRRFFKKPFNSANIKVRFVKSEMGYNGHMEIAEATKEQSLTLLEKIKLDNPLIKNIYWDLVSE